MLIFEVKWTHFCSSVSHRVQYRVKNSLEYTALSLWRNKILTVSLTRYMFFVKECGTHWTNSSTKGRERKKKRAALVVFKSRAAYFQCMYFFFFFLAFSCYFPLNPALSYLSSVATLLKDKLAIRGHKFMLNSLDSQNHDSASAKEFIQSCVLIQNIYGAGIII